MKRDDIKKIFEGATDEQISAVLNINSADIGAAKKKLEDERDSYKAQLETATQKLESFKDVNVEELKGQIATLTKNLADEKANYEKQLADRDFDDLLNGEIRGSKAKNVTAVRALLDVETLKTSKNQKNDIAAALQKTKIRRADRQRHLCGRYVSESQGQNPRGNRQNVVRRVQKVPSGKLRKGSKNIWQTHF